MKNAASSIESPRDSYKAMKGQFAKEGYVSPFRLLSPQECRQFLRSTARRFAPSPLDWEKGHAATSRAFYEIATHPALIEKLTALLGENVMLWGASVQTRLPGAVHPWHSDIESSSASPGKTLSVWIGIRNLSADSCLLVIPKSHRFGITVQEARSRYRISRNAASNEDILELARERDEQSRLLRLEMTDGEAFIFDGQLWHGSHNVSGKTRQALLLQYAAPDIAIRIPDLNYLDWPFRRLESPKPACIMIRGSDKSGVNRIVSPPVASNGEASRQLNGRIHPLRLPLAPDTETGWKPYSILDGYTEDLRWLSCHASALAQGRCPHPPHAHDEEELLLLLAGEVDLILPDAQTADGNQRRRLRPGHLIYYPARFAHTLETVSESAANYMMFKWCGARTKRVSPLAFGQFDISDHFTDLDAGDGFRPRLVFEGRTAYLQKLHCHASTLAPSAGYEPHIDPYDVAIVVLEGEVETLGSRAGPHSVIFYPAGEPHGMHNPVETVAKYLVFEFHGRQGLWSGSLFARSASLLAKLRDPGRVKRKLKQLVRRHIDA